MPGGPVSQAVLTDSVYTVDEKYLILMEYLLGWFNFHVKKQRQEEQLFSCDGKVHLVVCDHVDNSPQVSSLSMSHPIFKISCIFSHKNDSPCKCGDHASIFLLSICLSTLCFRRRFHKYGFGKDLKSHGSGQGMFQIKAYIPQSLLMSRYT